MKSQNVTQLINIFNKTKIYKIILLFLKRYSNIKYILIINNKIH